MTSSTVNLRGVVGNGSFSLPTPKVQETGGGTDFSQVLENATSKDGGVQTTDYKHRVEQEALVEDVRDTQQTNDTSEKEETKGITESQKPENVEVSEEDLEEAMEVIRSAVLEIRQLFCETLGISEEEFMQALDALGMTEMDLLAAGNASKLTLYLEGQNELALLTNEELYNTVQSLEGELSQISEDLVRDLNQISPEEAGQLFDEALKLMDDAGVSKENGLSKEVPVITIAENAEGQEVAAPQNLTEGENGPKEGKGEEQQNNSNLFAGNQVVNSNFQQNITNVQNTGVMFEMDQTQVIMDQIMEYMDIQLEAEESTMQMQLHPEELGTLQITISAKAGVMTAQFTAESEAVKAVLENQIVQLQDRFEQQNIKVEAIEISVATHGFEQNLQQDESAGSYQEEEKKARVRKIDLDSLEAIDELSEEDQVVADMMQLHGNRLDFMA